MPSAVINKTEGTFVIPAAHTDRLQAILAGRQTAPVPLERIVQQIFSSDYSAVFNVPALLIKKLATSDKATRLVLCANFDPVTEVCPCGDKCKFVHADTRGAAKSTVHNNYAWPSLDAVTYERFEAGQALEVAAPSSKNVVDVLPSEMALKTKALESTRRPLSHCAHYYLNRTCNLGPDCQFIHAVLIDRDAKPHQRAPAPPKLTTTQPNTPPPRKNRSPVAMMDDSTNSASVCVVDALPPPSSFDGRVHVGTPFRLGLAPPSMAMLAQDVPATPEPEASVDDIFMPLNGSCCSTSLLHQFTELSLLTSPRELDSPAPSAASEFDTAYIPAPGEPYNPLVAAMLYRGPRSTTTTPSGSRRGTTGPCVPTSPAIAYAPALPPMLVHCL